ncbi:MAG TPA: [Fe-Fe] hydrogenase large subunit C-terminal domain-containing protein [Myxococcota bacterium]|nr:[Fe-Fe] hydrogenase large subunit C-terminal domain-containing protein [Myxococcota bacterium]
MAVLWTIPERCRRCYTCVRECPAKAIRVENGQAQVIPERCIACGNCVKVCAQGAKQVQDDVPRVRAMLASGRPVIACIAPAFPAAFDRVEPGRVIQAVRKLGFAEVWEVAFGAELLVPEYVRLFHQARRTGQPVIATCCPAIVTYVEKFLPSLHPYLAPLVSPKLAAARAVRARHQQDVHVVFVGPCIAKKHGVQDGAIHGVLDAVLTFEELVRMFEADGIDPATQPPSAFDGPRAHMGRTLPVSGGLLKAAGLSPDILANDIVVTEGKERVLATLKDLAEGRTSALFYDLLFCEGCIDGPKMLNDLSPLARKERLINYVVEKSRYVTQRELAEALGEFADVDLSRRFLPQDQTLPLPPDDAIEAALEAMRKTRREDQLDCGACGYPTCREKAIAVCQGLAEPAMCLPYLVDELEQTCADLRTSHQELESAQKALLKTERLASMGQLSAGVAHELNNPLGTILLYSHMVMRELADARQREDLQLIVNEAMRCKDIVRGLLDFARKSRVTKAPARLDDVLHEVEGITRVRADEAGVTVSAFVDGPLPLMMIDRSQIRQALVNMVVNAIDATPAGGRIEMRGARLNGDVRIEVRDTGCGIPADHLPKLFTPFFSTKESGKGTGLGLAITYGVVKMHSGDITVDSEVGRGTTFTIRLPVEPPDAGDEGGDYRVEEHYFR